MPPLKARVTDLTGTLNAQQASALEHTLAEFEHRKGAQIAVLLVPTTKPESAFDYAMRVLDAWKLGRKGIDDGVLVVVAKGDRRVWIATGRGVEGVLPDAIVKRIVDEEITPRFKAGDFYGGLRAGTDRMMRLIEGEKLPPPPAAAPHAAPHGGPQLDPGWIFFIFVGVLAVGAVLRPLLGPAVGASVVGGAAGFFVWIVFSSLLFGVVAGLIAFLITLLNTGRGGGSSGWSSGSGWSSSGGSWSSSSGSSGGGFSGGGGSSSGGGAGGSW